MLRYTHRILPTLATIAIVLAAVTANTRADDWPAYRADSGRSGYTPETLPAALHLQWTRLPAHRPKPAWPDPVREENVLAFDHAPQPVSAGDLLFVGSTADHTLRAIDTTTGKTRWTFVSDAPIRFAPQLHDSKLYLASDDGCVYCLDQRTGKQHWRFQAAPHDQRIVGNGQIISRWPLRSGLVVAEDTVYLTAGMWPLDGVFAIAISASDGKELWRRGYDALAPQGYLSIAGATIFTPAGRAPMWAIARADGSGGPTQQRSWAFIGQSAVVTGPGTLNRNENLPATPDDDLPPRPTNVTVWPMRMNRPLAGPPNTRTATITPDAVYAAGRDKVVAYTTTPNWQAKWQTPFADAWEIIATADAVVVGGTNTVSAFNASDGKQRWTATVDGKARGLAMANGKLFVTTDTGTLYCFAEKQANAAVVKETRSAPPTTHRQTAANLLKDSPTNSGICMIVGVGDASLAAELATQSKLQVVCVEPDEKKVATARATLAAEGLYGRVVVHHVSGTHLPYADYLANLLIVQDTHVTIDPAELYRVLRPAGGIAYRLSTEKNNKWIVGEGLTHHGMAAAQSAKATRGPLSGAADWTHQYGTPAKSGSSGDTRAKWPLKMLWFGEPGPAKIMNRHLRGTAPVTNTGRMFILGQHTAIAVDAYNGTELWTRNLPSIQRRVVDILGGSMAADDDGVYLCSSNLVLALDGASGNLTRTYRLPLAQPRISLAKPQTLSVGETGTITIAATADGLELTLETKDAKIANADPASYPARGDAWELFFDFRPASARNGLPEKGVFHAVVVPGSSDAHAGPWAPVPEMNVASDKGDTGSKTLVKIPWAAVGGKTPEFTFGAILNTSDNGKQLTGRAYKFATPASYRLADFGAAMIVDADKATPAPDAAATLTIDDWPHEQLIWGHMTVARETIVGSVVAIGDTGNTLAHGWDFSSEGHDYTGPPPARVLGILGIANRTSHLFALDKSTGRPRWVYRAKQSIGHNAITVVDGRVYVLDRLDPAKREELTRRGETPPPDTDTLVVLDATTGKTLATVTENLSDYDGLRAGNGVLLATSMQSMTAFDISAGKAPEKLWTVTSAQPMHHCSAFLRAPVITSQWVYDEPTAYGLRTGDPKPGLKWGHFRGCGTVSGTENLLMFRPATSAVLDISGNTGRHVITGVRPGCYINMIAACGLVLMQEASSGCGCPYNFQTTVALMPAQ